MIDWDDAFDNSGYIAGSEVLPDTWTTQAAAMRTLLLGQGRAQLDLRYGTGDREVFDLFEPETPPKGTVVFVHGGFWRMLDKSYWSHYARGCLENGWSVAMPSYPLAPQARISEITSSIAKAVIYISEQVQGDLALIGHSAGGHLVTRMVCDGVLPTTVAARIRRVVSVSGVHHLNPLLETKMNDDLRLDLSEANAESPVHLEPVKGVKITFFVGDQERPEFLRQTRMMAERWEAKSCDISSVYEQGTHHFSVIGSLQNRDGALTKAVLG